MPNNITVLKPVHTSFDTAYVIESYPYGRLRTQMKIWIETRANMGQRVVTCTLNPKNQKWNKPHAGIYHLACVLFVNNDNGHVENDGIGQYNLLERSESFLEVYGDGLDQERRDKLLFYKACNDVQEKQGIHLISDKAGFYIALKKLLDDMGRSDLFVGAGKSESANLENRAG